MKNYFENCTTHDEAKKLYRRLAMELHPDKGGSDAEFQELNRQYRDFCEGKRTSSADSGSHEGDKWDWRQDIANFFAENGLTEYADYMRTFLDGFDLADIVRSNKVSGFVRKMGNTQAADDLEGLENLAKGLWHFAKKVEK